MYATSKTFRPAPHAVAAAVLCALATLVLVPAPAAAGEFDCYEGCTDSLVAFSGCVESAASSGDWHTSCTGLADCPDAGSAVTVLSIHGGKIESGTTEIGDDLAAIYGWNRYDFNAHLRTTGACRALADDGSSSNDNSEVLHITGTKFNHADALAVVGAHPDAVSIHGCGASCDDDTICIGGRNTQQINVFDAYFDQYEYLVPAAVEAVPAPSTTPFCGANIDGDHPDNIVNRTSTGQGLQLEISYDVRQDLASDDMADDLLRNVVYGAVAAALGEPPPPLATLFQVETYERNGTTYERFRFHIENKLEYPQEMFETAPGLPPCGANTSAPRMRIRIYSAIDDSYLYGFCGFNDPAYLDLIWFARPQGTAPAAIYIELEDVATGRVYRSNRVSTTP